MQQQARRARALLGPTRPVRSHPTPLEPLARRTAGSRESLAHDAALQFWLDGEEPGRSGSLTKRTGGYFVTSTAPVSMRLG